MSSVVMHSEAEDPPLVEHLGGHGLMRIERLRKVLELRSRAKMGVCLWGNASKPGDVRVDSSVRVVLSSMELLQEPPCSRTLFLAATHRITRRIQTHRRHLEGHPILGDYFRQAKAL